MLVVTPNVCFDVTVRLPALIPGTVMRATHTITTAGGKGVNVIRAARARGTTDARLVSFLPAEDGARFAELLSGEGTTLLSVPAEGQTRVATIFLEESGRASVINGRGPEISAAQWDALLALVRDNLQPGEVLVCSGSLPPGVPLDGYAQLVAVAHEAGGRAVVDAAPAALLPSLAERPDLVSPNLSEAEGMLFGRTDEQVHETGDDIPDRAVLAATELHARGAVRAVVTAGAAGAALCTANGTWWFTAPSVQVVSPVGAGDSFVGGAAPLLAAGAEDTDIVRTGMATASSSVEQERAGGVDPARVEELIGQITVRAWERASR